MSKLAFPRLHVLMLICLLLAVGGCDDSGGAYGGGLTPTAPAMDMDYNQNPYVYLYISPAASFSRVDAFQGVNHAAYLRNYGTVRANATDSWQYEAQTFMNTTQLSSSHYFRNCIAGENWTVDGSFYANSPIYGTLEKDGVTDSKTCFLA